MSEQEVSGRMVLLCRWGMRSGGGGGGGGYAFTLTLTGGRRVLVSQRGLLWQPCGGGGGGWLCKGSREILLTSFSPGQ